MNSSAVMSEGGGHKDVISKDRDQKGKEKERKEKERERETRRALQYCRELGKRAD
jgi:hypothetical protein